MKKWFTTDKNRWRENVRYLAYNYLISVLIFIVIEMLARHSVAEGIHFVWNHPFLTLLGALVLTAFYSVSLLFPKRNFVWLVITVVILMLAVTNFVLLFFRITPLAATDFSLIMSVFEIMDMFFTKVQFAALVCLAVIVLGALVWLGIHMKKQPYAFLPGLLCAAILIGGTSLVLRIGDRTGLLQTEFANLPDAYDENGFVYCFMRSLFDRGIAKPEAYSEESVDDILATIKNENTNAVTETPNIIFLQLESFMDLSRLKDVSYSENPIPIFSSLMESCQTGFLTVPSVGAGTANTEFEVLTGMNIDYFGAGEYPYKTVLQDTVCESMAYNLEELGYKTTAIHNNTATFYDRDLVFENLGFDCFDSLEYMKDVVYNPIGWAKDKVLTQEIMNSLSATEETDFIYTISVQDHGKYPTEPQESPHITVSGFAPEDEERQNSFVYYVNQVHETDAFIGSLVSALDAYDEPVVLVMYGDHLPNIDMEDEELSAGSRFQTEYVIWTNQDKYMKKQENKDLCAYQLSAYVLGRLGMNNGLLTKFHQSHAGESDYEEELEMLQYDMLYGKQEVYGGVVPYQPKEITMGIEPVSITDVSDVGGSIYVLGKNFTESSVVCVGDKRQETVFLNENTLMVPDKQLEDGDTIKVAQMTEIHEILSETDTYYCK